jgi:hypothetical protein
LDELSEEERKSGDQQPIEHCGTPEGQLEKRGFDRHPCHMGEQLGRSGVEKVPTALFYKTGIVQNILMGLDNADCSCHIFLVY